MVNACPPTPKEKCRACRLGHPCPIHGEKNDIDYDALAKRKRKKHSGSKKGKKRISKGTVEKQKKAKNTDR